MKPVLLDMSVLIALSWPHHVHHLLARNWFRLRRQKEFRTCPITQAGFLRLTLNPTVSKMNFDSVGAFGLLERITAMETHGFWADDIPIQSSLWPNVALGHQQVTDAYLLILAAKKGGVLATLDGRIVQLSRALKCEVEVLQGVS